MEHQHAITRNGRPYSSAGQYLLALVKERASTATTVRGALRFLAAHRPPPIAGLTAPGTRAFRNTRHNTDDIPPNLRRRNRWQRLASRAQSLARSAATSATPFVAIEALCQALTDDILPLAQRRLCLLLSQRIAGQLAADWPYRRSESKWAGGDHTVSVDIVAEPCATGSSIRAWSGNGKWCGTDSEAKLGITRRCIETLGERLIVGGLITLDCVQKAPREYQATWAEQGRGFDLRLVSGWIIRGYHISGGSLEKARRVAARARQNIAEQALLERTHLAEISLEGLMVRVSDSLKAGNCKTGTSSFVRTYQQAINGRAALPAVELLALRDDVHTRRAVVAAHVRQRAISSRTNEAAL